MMKFLYFTIITAIIAHAAATALTYRVAAHERACFFAWNDEPGQKIAFYFAVQSGGSFDIDYVVTDPRERTIIEGDRERQGDFVFTGNDIGEYSFCFANDMSTFVDKLIDFEITIENEPRPELPLPKTGQIQEHTSEVEESIFRLSGSINSITRTQKYFRTREHRNFSTVQSTETRIFWYSVLQSCLIITLSALQVFIVRTFFSTSGKHLRV